MDALLTSMGLEKFIQKFKDEDVDLEAAKSLTEDELKDLGLTLGARKKLYLALHPETAAPAAAAAASAPPPPPPGHSSGPPPPPPGAKASGPALSEKIEIFGHGASPVAGLFKAKELGHNMDVQGLMWRSLPGPDARIFALTDTAVQVIKKPELGIEKLIKPPNAQCNFFPHIFTGWGDLLAAGYAAKGTKDGGIMTFSCSQKKVLHKLDIFTGDDEIRGLAFVNNNQLVTRFNAQTWRNGIWLVDATTGEPVSKHEVGGGDMSVTEPFPQNVLESSPHLPNMVLHQLIDKIEVLDVRQSLTDPAQVWNPIPKQAVIFMDHFGWEGIPRVVITGDDPSSGNKQVQVWDMRKGSKMFVVDSQFSFDESCIYKNMLVTHKGTFGYGDVHFFDLNKAKIDGGVVRGPPTAMVHGNGNHMAARRSSYAFDDNHLYVSCSVIGW